MIPGDLSLHSLLEGLFTLGLLAVLAWLVLARRRDAKSAQERLTQEAARHAAVIESASDAVISIDEAQRIVLFNRSAERLLGCPREAAIGTPVERFIPVHARAHHAARLAELARGADPDAAMGAGRTVRALRADGSVVEVEAAVSRAAEPGREGRQLFTVVLRDISGRRAAERALFRVTERYRHVVEQSPDAIWLAEGGRLLLANPACVALLGAQRVDELLGRPLTDFLPAWPPGEAEGAPARQLELRVRRLDGGERDVELSMAEVPDHGGDAVQGVMRDVTERRQRESELRRTRDALLQAEQVAGLGYFEYDAASDRWNVSSSLGLLHGLPEGATLTSAEGFQVVHPDDRETLRRHFDPEALRARRHVDTEYRIVRPTDGALRWAHAIGRVEADEAGQVRRLFVTVQDITDRKLAALALERSREELRLLSASLTTAREEERRRVARELHDELGQRLSALKLDLRTLGLAAGAGGAGLADALASQLPPLLASVDDAIAATRRIAADLRPAMLDDLGLSAALEWLADGWGRRTGIQITLQADAVDERVSETAAITLYRIVQEALTNVARHAEARHVQVELGGHGEEFVVVVQDDGRGIAPGDTDKRGASGLAGVRERARILGGAATLRNVAGGGCRLEVRLPVERIDSEPGTLRETP